MQKASKKVATDSSLHVAKEAPKASVSPDFSEANPLWHSLAMHVGNNAAAGAGNPLPIQRKLSQPISMPQIQRMCAECDEELNTDAETRIQTKLTVGASDDPMEKEADALADKVMRMPEPKEKSTSQGKINTDRTTSGLLAGNSETSIQRQEEPEQENLLQAKATPGHTPQVTPNVAANIQSLKGGGHPLPENQRDFFESRMGHDFSGVRIHTDSKAADTAKSIQAKAFTLGNNIVFNAGQYSPNNQDGKKLLAHELTHVVQQNGGTGVGLQRAPTSFAPFTGNNAADLVMREPERQRPTLSPPVPDGPEMGDDPVADSSPAEQEQWVDLDVEVWNLRLQLYEAQEASWHATRGAWSRRANSMRTQLATAGTNEEMESIREELKELETEMWDASIPPQNEWLKLKDEAALAMAETLTSDGLEGIYAFNYLMKEFKIASSRMGRIEAKLSLREDFVDFAEVLGSREYVWQGELRAARERFREFMGMLETIGDLREAGEDANELIPGWEEMVVQEIDILINLAGEAPSLIDAQRFGILQERLQNAKVYTLSRKPKRRGFFDEVEAASRGIVHAVADPLVEAAKQGVDVVKILTFTGYKWLGGDGWTPELYSDMAEHVDQSGASTLDIIKAIPAGILETPERCFKAIKSGDWEAIGNEGANLFMLVKGGRQAPGKIRSVAKRAMKVYRVLKFRALSLRDGRGMSMAALKAVQQIAVEHGLEIAFRPVSRAVTRLRKLGHAGKPEFLKMKTINELDVLLGANKADIGKVGFFKPKMPPSKSLLKLSKKKLNDLIARDKSRTKNINDPDMKKMINERTASGELKVRDGVVFKMKGNGAGKAYTGDHDAYSFTKNGVDIPFEKLKRQIRAKLEADPIHTEHGAALSWDDIKAGQAQAYADNILNHRPGGDGGRLVVFKPDGTIAREFFEH